MPARSLDYYKIRQYMLQSSVGVLPLPNIPPAAIFTSPLKLFEYMSAGLPIVLSDLPSLREIVEEGKTGLFYRPDEAEDLARVLKICLSDPEASLKRAERAREEMKEYTWQRRAEKIEEFFLIAVFPPNFRA